MGDRSRSPAPGAHLNHADSYSNSTSINPSSTQHHTRAASFGANDIPTSSYSNEYSNPQFSNPSFLDYDAAFDSSTSLSGDFSNQAYLNPQDLQTQGTQNLQYTQQVDHLSPHNTGQGSTAQVSANDFPSFDLGQSLDPSLLYDPQLLDPNQAQNNTLDPNKLSLDVNHMATLQHHSATPPHLLQHRTSQSPSPRHTPSPQQAMFNPPTRPRNASESLDPSSAAYPQGYGSNEWGAGMAFRTHRRTPSDTLSEISSHSAQASPYLGTMDSFDQVPGVSPMLNAQQDQPLFGDSLGLNHFSLNDPSVNQISPGHSPHVSPRLGPTQQPLPNFSAENNFGLGPDLSTHYQGHNDGLDMFPGMNHDAFTSMHQNTSPQEGQADQMSPPEINIDFAPPSRTNTFEPSHQVDFDNALSPPENLRRKRAKSDPYSSRPSSPGVSGRGRSPSLQPGLNGLTPANIQLPPSRSPSPASSRGRSNSSASTSNQRDYMLDLANPERGSSAGSDVKRQKHPATFRCTLCTKKFTRAYNLRSHLRTHTDERPFVCTVCGKAFARQHDRKRHEGLHSGEKKFVCRGLLKSQSPWGCGRRFARADALGRHFRSEAGRECIKPLLDEEAAERQRQWLEEQREQQMQSAAGFVAPGPMKPAPQLDPVLPAALLQMYPEFANLDWGNVQGGADLDAGGGHGGRNSFDASSGNEWEGLSENEMEMELGQQYDRQQNNHQLQPGAQQQQQQQHNAYGGGWNGASDYLSDFEGR